MNSVLCLQYVCSSKTSVNFYQTTWRRIPDSSPLPKNLKIILIIRSSEKHNIVTCMCDYRWGFRFHIGFIGHLYTQLRTMSNYSTTTDLHSSQITAACLFQPAVFSQQWRFFSFHTQVLSEWHLPSNSLFFTTYRTDLSAPVVFLITPQHGARRQHCSFPYANPFCRNMFTSTSNRLHNPVC
jgi:hypothetical protein